MIKIVVKPTTVNQTINEMKLINTATRQNKIKSSKTNTDMIPVKNQILLLTKNRVMKVPVAATENQMIIHPEVIPSRMKKNLTEKTKTEKENERRKEKKTEIEVENAKKIETEIMIVTVTGKKVIENQIAIETEIETATMIKIGKTKIENGIATEIETGIETVNERKRKNAKEKKIANAKKIENEKKKKSVNEIEIGIETGIETVIATDETKIDEIAIEPTNELDAAAKIMTNQQRENLIDLLNSKCITSLLFRVALENVCEF